MTNQSVITLFIVFAMMSATLFFHQVAMLDRVKSQSTINLTQINHSIKDFEQSAAKYRKAIEIKNKSDFVRGVLDFILSPFSSVVDFFLDSVTDIEDEADATITAASRSIKNYQNVLVKAEQTQKLLAGQQIQQIIAWRNIGLILCLFSLSSAFFAKTPRLEKTSEVLLAKDYPVSIKKALWLSIAGGIVSSFPSFDGGLFQLALPSLCIAYFIVYRQLQNEQVTWQKRTLKIVAFSVWVSLVIFIFYAWLGMSVGFAVSGFLLGLFIASAIQYASLPLTTRQFFLVALVFAVARLVAALSAAEAGSELIVLEGLLAVIGVLWVIQAHASWVRLVKFDILLSWFFIYSLMAFTLGNYFQAGASQLVFSYLAISLSGGGFLTYHLSKTRTNGHFLIHLPNQENVPITLVRENNG